MKCAHAIDVAMLADYWAGALAGLEEEAVEEHLLGCGDCSGRLSEVAALAEGIRKLAREGSLRMIVNDGYLKRMASEGLRIREYAPKAGGGVQCTVTAEDDVLIGRLSANLSETRQVDLCLCDASGMEQLRLKDIPVHVGSGDVVLQESITFAKAAPDNVMIARLVALDDAGGEQLLGEYTFNHKRSMPGPGAW